MRTSTFFCLIASTLITLWGVGSTPRAEAGAIPWTYNAIFGYGPMFPRQYGYTAGYSPMYGSPGYGSPGYGSPGMWGANYGYAPIYSTNYAPSMSWSPAAAPVTTYYGPSYYGGGAVYSGSGSAGCGCNPCGYAACDPCGTGSGCPNGDCSASGGNYSPSPTSTKNENSEVTPTFKPTVPEKPATTEPSDDFVPVERREEDFVSPRANSTIPNTTVPNTTIPKGASSTIPNRTNVAPGDPSSTIPGGATTTIPGAATPVPMSPIERPLSPAESTIPGVGERSTLPEGSRSTIPNGAGTTVPESRSFPPEIKSNFAPPISRPAPTEPSTEEVSPVVPTTDLEPLELIEAPVATVNVNRQRVIMKAGYRFPAVTRINVPAQKMMEAGSSNLAIR